ncbi:MAG TPA: RHS repeat-associated core domain-containing protein [Terracidiphilus sp.]|nr:RHS repeat-associated core domain-containing protein [Terracidiphilus sp.]
MPCAPYLFTGKERDTESGNDYFGARYYGSSMGRFMSPDPLLPMLAWTPTSSQYQAFLQNPQDWNLYAYVLNNPLINTDPTGYECVWDNGSYDSENDKDTGSVGQCQGQGGTWIELGQNGGWSDSSNSSLQNAVQTIANNAANGMGTAISVIGANGTPNVTVYNSSGLTIGTATNNQITQYGYTGSSVLPSSESFQSDPFGMLTSAMSNQIIQSQQPQPDPLQLLGQNVMAGSGLYVQTPQQKKAQDCALGAAGLAVSVPFVPEAGAARLIYGAGVGIGGLSYATAGCFPF